MGLRLLLYAERKPAGAAADPVSLTRLVIQLTVYSTRMGCPTSDIRLTPLIAEGRIHSPAQARACLDAGAFAVVVGTAITHPTTITGWFAGALA